MSQSPEEKVELLRQHIAESEDIVEDDRDRLLELSDALEESTRARRHEDVLRHCMIIAEEVEGGLFAASLSDRDATERIVDWIFDTGFSEKENRNFRVAMRVYGKKLSEGDDDECPPSIGWISTHTSADYDAGPGHMI